jgi:hypothetical protein
MKTTKRSILQKELKEIDQRLGIKRRAMSKRNTDYVGEVALALKNCTRDCNVLAGQIDELADRRAVVLAKLNAEDQFSAIRCRAAEIGKPGKLRASASLR